MLHYWDVLKRLLTTNGLKKKLKEKGYEKKRSRKRKKGNSVKIFKENLMLMKPRSGGGQVQEDGVLGVLSIKDVIEIKIFMVVQAVVHYKHYLMDLQISADDENCCYHRDMVHETYGPCTVQFYSKCF